MADKMIIENRQVFVYGKPDADLWIIQPVDERYINTIDLEIQEINNLTDNADFFLIAVIISDWNSELSPWKTAPVFGKDSFGGGADATLSFITNSLIPALENSFNTASKKRYAVAGYSLAGLFALWSGFRTEIFSGIAAVSPSVWFPEFVKFTKKGSIKARHIYLSLGDTEAHTKNPVMQTVAKCLDEEYRILTKQNVTCILEWNEGNHFKNAELRTAKGIAWVISHQAHDMSSQ